ncbi:MAG: sugar-binding transcriptional regulator, partial [Bacillota bacterium]
PGLIAVPLVGGMGQDIRYEIHSNSLVVDFSRNFGCQSRVLHAPAIAERENLKDAILGDSESGEIIEQAKKTNIGLVGLGALNESSTMIQTGFFSISDFKEIKEKGAIGEVCSFFFDHNGQVCDIDINKRVIGVSPYDLKNIETVIAVVAGDRKEKSLHAALRGQFINILVTDEMTAEKVLLIEGATK